MTIDCKDPIYTFWSDIVAMPSIIVWGLGIPFFALVLMYRDRKNLEKVEVKEKFGFLYNGYQTRYFYWEIVIMYRKIGMIFIAVFIQPYGVIVQAMIVFLLMVIFLLITIKKKPYLSLAINELETISLVTSSLSIFCGIFFISSIPASDIPNIPESVKGTIVLSDNMKFALFAVIVAANVLFFSSWIYNMIKEIHSTLIKKFEKVYLALVLCGNRTKMEQLKNRQRIEEENENLREKYYKAINHLKKLYTDG